ncbi:hypothetical protein LCGC14_1970990, partial [marine sediment metagenome]
MSADKRDVKDIKESHEVIDVLHLILIEWGKGESEAILEILTQTESQPELFYRI